MLRFATYAAQRAADFDSLSDLTAPLETASFAPRTQSYVASEPTKLELDPLILPAEVDQPLMLRCGCSYCAKASRELDPDRPQSTGLLDAHGDTIATAGTITVDGPHIIATLNAIGDQDFFAVELTAGQWYNIGQYLTVGGPTLIPLADAYIELYDQNGNLITTADGGGPNTPSGLDALLTFQAEYTGTYYINARAYDQDPLNGTTGDFVGDYELFVDTATPSPYAYRPFYSVDSPLHSIDWGSQVDRTSRNPDGNNGTRPNPQAPDGNGPIITNPYGIEGKNVITYYFAKQGDVFIDEDPLNPGLATMLQARNMEAWEKEAFRKALDLYEQVADVLYIEVDNRAEADFKFITYQGTPGVGASLLGRMSPPNELNEGQTEFNAGDVRWTEEGLQQGGFYFPTLLHELGHGHGLAHPHDNGGRSSIMPGADGGTGGLGGGFGDWGLSQQVYTIMSYNDGWNEGAPYGARPAGHGGPRSGGITGTEVDHFGWMGTLAALDIAVLQDKYGVNEEWATGNDLYEIKDFNGAGNFYSTIWDGGGTDEIRYSGAAAATIDLRAATLRYEEGGGGRVSYAYGLWGGFTIANGVTIENATGGSGNDTLIGNDAANVLNGRGGDDVMAGGLGDDTYHVNSAGDLVQELGTAGTDTVLASVSYTLGANVENLTLTTTANLSGTGNALNNVLNGNGGANSLSGGGGDDVISGRSGDDVLAGQNGNDRLFGGGGDDRLWGGGGDDRLEGGDGSDLLSGGAGADRFVFLGASGSDVVLDFDTAGGDILHLDRAIFANFSDVLTHTADDGRGNTVISKSGVVIKLNGVLKADLAADDFAFGGAAATLAAKGPGPLVLPAEDSSKEAWDDQDPLVLPDGFDFDQPLVLPGKLADGATDDPLVLPGDPVKDWLEGPVVCDPSVADGLMPNFAEIDVRDVSVTSFWRRQGLETDWVLA